MWYPRGTHHQIGLAVWYPRVTHHQIGLAVWYPRVTHHQIGLAVWYPRVTHHQIGLAVWYPYHFLYTCELTAGAVGAVLVPSIKQVPVIALFISTKSSCCLSVSAFHQNTLSLL